MARTRSPVSTGSFDFSAEVEFVGVPDNDLGRKERARILHDILKQWSVRATTRGRPRSNGWECEDET
jgi:hypothetical protein